MRKKYIVKLKVKEAIEKRDITQKKLAEMSSIRESTISDIVRGTRTVINFEHLSKIAEALQGLKAVAILDKADSLNSAGGALFEDVTSAMYVNKKQVPMVNYIYGIGGRDTTTMQIESVYNDLQEIVKTGETGNPYRYLGLRKGEE